MTDRIIDSIIKRLGENYRDDREIVEDLLEDYRSIASDVSGRNENDESLVPYIKTAVISAYLRMGGEGTKGTSTGQDSYSYEDIEEKLRKDSLSCRVLKWY